MKLSIKTEKFPTALTSISQILQRPKSVWILNMKKAVKRWTKTSVTKIFSFETVLKKDVLNLITELPRNKATVSNDIPVLVLKESISAYNKKLTNVFRNCARKATGFKSLRMNCFEINQVTSKCQIDFLDKTCKKRYKTETNNITIEFYMFELV